MKGKVALVTGAAKGIGAGAAKELASRGTKVYITDILDEQGAQIVAEINATGGSAEYLHLDVSDKSAIEQTVSAIVKQEGKLDYAINNAGIGGKLSPLHDITTANWNRMMDVNLSGVFYCMQSEIKTMLTTGGGSIVNVSSLAGLNGVAYGASYSAAKHGVIGLTKSAAFEYGKLNIRINSMCPGFIETDIIKDIPEHVLEMNSKLRVPLKRIGQVSEIAKSIAFLLSDDASYITGMNMNVDGGFQAG